MSLTPEFSIFSTICGPISIEVAVGSVGSQRCFASGALIGLASDQFEDLVRLAVHDDGHGFYVDIAVVDGRPESCRVARFLFELVQLIENSDAVHGANWYKFPVH